MVWKVVKGVLFLVEAVEWGAVVVISAIYGSLGLGMFGLFCLLTAAMLTFYIG